MQSADLTLGLPEAMQLPVPEWVDEEDVVDREEVLSWQVRPEEDAVYFLSLVAGDIDAVAEVASTTDVARTVDLTPVEGGDAFYAYAEVPLRAADGAFLSAFDAPGLVVVPPIV